MFRRPLAILFLAIHLFSIGGQLAIYQYAVIKSDRLFNREIGENHYNIDDLTEICIPMRMPGVTDWKYFQPIHGRVQFSDASYNYVKIRITRDAIYLWCIPNYNTTHLSDQNIVYALQIHDIPVHKKEHVAFGKINMVPYDPPVSRYEIIAPPIFVRNFLFAGDSFVPDASIAGPSQPPDPYSSFLS
jgi:hypothetical protein